MKGELGKGAYSLDFYSKRGVKIHFKIGALGRMKKRTAERWIIHTRIKINCLKSYSGPIRITKKHDTIPFSSLFYVLLKLFRPTH